MSQLVRLLRHQERELENREQSFQNYFQPYGLQRAPPHTRVPGLGWLFPPRTRQPHSSLPSGSSLADLFATSSAEPHDAPEPDGEASPVLPSTTSDPSALDGIALTLVPNVGETSGATSGSSSSSSCPSPHHCRGGVPIQETTSYTVSSSSSVQPSVQHEDIVLVPDPGGSHRGTEPSLATASSGRGGFPHSSALPNNDIQQIPEASPPLLSAADLCFVNDQEEIRTEGNVPSVGEVRPNDYWSDIPLF
eukprot:RCo027698